MAAPANLSCLHHTENPESLPSSPAPGHTCTALSARPRSRGRALPPTERPRPHCGPPRFAAPGRRVVRFWGRRPRTPGGPQHRWWKFLGRGYHFGGQLHEVDRQLPPQDELAAFVECVCDVAASQLSQEGVGSRAHHRDWRLKLGWEAKADRDHSKERESDSLSLLTAHIYCRCDEGTTCTTITP